MNKGQKIKGTNEYESGDIGKFWLNFLYLALADYYFDFYIL